MRTFKVGDRVRIVDGSLVKTPGHGRDVGKLATVVTPLVPYQRDDIPELPLGTLVHRVECDDGWLCAGVPTWFEPHWPGKEATEWTAELRNLCGIGSKVGA